MKTTDYKAILAAVEQALAVCNESSGYMDEVQRKICQDLSDARTQILYALRSATDSRPEQA